MHTLIPPTPPHHTPHLHHTQHLPNICMHAHTTPYHTKPYRTTLYVTIPFQHTTPCSFPGHACCTCSHLRYVGSDAHHTTASARVSETVAAVVPARHVGGDTKVLPCLTLLGLRVSGCCGGDGGWWVVGSGICGVWCVVGGVGGRARSFLAGLVLVGGGGGGCCGGHSFGGCG
jgi:hypothetical protein